jgi:hypothetical protein
MHEVTDGTYYKSLVAWNITGFTADADVYKPFLITLEWYQYSTGSDTKESLVLNQLLF